MSLSVQVRAVQYERVSCRLRERVTDEEQKTLCQLLNQLQIEPGVDPRDMQKINILLSYHEEV